MLPAGAGVGNPVDSLPTSGAENLDKVLTILTEEVKDQVDYIIVMNGDAGMMDNWALYQVARKFMETSPIPDACPSLCLRAGIGSSR